MHILLPVECVNFCHIYIIQFLDSILYLVFIGSFVHNEYQGVVILYLFHGRLGCQRVFDDSKLI